jgi:superfamily II DNA or RNA helicase
MKGFISRLRLDHFTANRAHGQAHLDRGGVVVLDQLEERVVARIQNPKSAASVALVDWSEIRERWVRAVCTCDAGSYPCQHLWAVLLWIEREPGVVLKGGNRKASLVDDLPGDLDPVAISRYQQMAAPSRWRQVIEKARLLGAGRPTPEASSSRLRPRQLYLAIDRYLAEERALNVSFLVRDEPESEAGEFVPSHLGASDVEAFPREQADLLRELLHFAAHTPRRPDPYGWSWRSEPAPVSWPGSPIPTRVLPSLVPRLCGSGQFGWQHKNAAGERVLEPLAWDDGPPWQLVLRGERQSDDDVVLRASLERESESISASASRMLFEEGLIFFDANAARIRIDGALPWLAALAQEPARELKVPYAELASALDAIGRSGQVPVLRFDAGLLPDESASFQPQLALTIEERSFRPRVGREIRFLYGETEVASTDSGLFVVVDGRPLRRDQVGEAMRIAEATACGFGPSAPTTFDRRSLAQAIHTLLEQGWRVLAQNRPLRAGGSFGLHVESGIDYFGLAGAMVFGDQTAELPALLQAARSEDRMVRLDDGSLGLLPEEWLSRYGHFAHLAQSTDEQGQLHFSRQQAIVLDALLAAEPGVRVDTVFERVRAGLRNFDRLEPCKAPPQFQGTLRPYQEVGLAWLELLGRLGVGGCLADDMGLGKTVQVLAWLQQRKNERGAVVRPALLVVPLSVVHNWVAEAARFTPELSVLVLHGLERAGQFARIADVDLVITTYGTLRRDVAALRAIAFDVVVLDEAQVIKNPHSDTAKACRLLRGDQRLALTGTPVENHLGDLWSIFEFLDPGLLGSLPTLAEHAGRSQLPPAALAQVAAALRPLILRRTKGEVLRELPEKSEQTLVCELSPKERKHYDGLLAYYRSHLKTRVDEIGFARSKVLVLEALLRLRQAACHVGLIDATRAKEPSAKLALLLEQVQEVVAEGHKVLVFSQFTKLLAIVRKRFEKAGIEYEYLDGRTRDREAKVQRFQEEPECRVFLISLKAGGIGLNLTAASYVFLLDPWWNPAVEMQAIDRAHRIGQRKPVFAYRLIARDTVEDRILELQGSKRALADAIIGGDQRILKQLTREDLDRLLS